MSHLSPLRSALQARHPSVCMEVKEEEEAVQQDDEDSDDFSAESPVDVRTVHAHVAVADACAQTSRRGPYELDEKEISAIRSGDGDGVERMRFDGVLLDDDDEDFETDDDDDPGYEPPSLEQLFEDARGLFNPARRIRQILAGATDADGISTDSLGRQSRSYGALTLLERAKWIMVRQEERIADLLQKGDAQNREIRDLKAQTRFLQQHQPILPTASPGQAPLEVPPEAVQALATFRKPKKKVEIPKPPAPTEQDEQAAEFAAAKANLATTVRNIVDSMKVERDRKQAAAAGHLQSVESSLRLKAVQVCGSLATLVSQHCASVPGVTQPPPYSAFVDFAVNAKQLLRRGGLVVKTLDDAEKCGAQVDRARKSVDEAVGRLVQVAGMGDDGGSTPGSRQGGKRLSMGKPAVLVDDPMRDQRDKRLCSILQQALDTLDFQLPADRVKDIEETELEGVRRDRELSRSPLCDIPRSTARLQRLVYTMKEAAVFRNINFTAVVEATDSLGKILAPSVEKARKAGFGKPERRSRLLLHDDWQRASRDIKDLRDNIHDVVQHACADAVVAAEHRWKALVHKLNEQRAAKEAAAQDSLLQINLQQSERMRPLRRSAAQLLVKSVMVRLKLRSLEQKSTKFTDFIMFGLRRAYFNQLAWLGLRRQQVCSQLMDSMARDWEAQKQVVFPIFFPWKRCPKPRTEVDGRVARNPPPSPPPHPPQRSHALWDALHLSLVMRANYFFRTTSSLTNTRVAVVRSQRLVSSQMGKIRKMEQNRQQEWRKVRAKEESLSAYATRVARGMFCHDVMQDWKPKQVGGTTAGWSSAHRPIAAADRSDNISGGLGFVMQKLRDHMKQQELVRRPLNAGEELVGKQVGSPKKKDADDDVALPPIHGATPSAPAEVPAPTRPARGVARAATQPLRPRPPRSREPPPDGLFGAAPPLAVNVGGGTAPLRSLVSDTNAGIPMYHTPRRPHGRR